ncbi:MAG: response regulator transcription factor [Chloroflexi bacterium]|nr:response regulator transcription factor [Chloroflexota bacterium]
MPTRVQIVDDHFLFAEALGSVIREIPAYDLVGIAVTGSQAISMAQEKQPEIILLDFHLPGYSADVLGPRLHSVAHNAKIVILTSDQTEASMVKGIQSGALGYLTKDRALDDVIRALDDVAAGAVVLSPEQLEIARRGQLEPGETLTQREIEILKLLSRGRDTLAIADVLTISANTVRTHLQNIFSKLGAHSKLEAVTVAKDRGLLG